MTYNMDEISNDGMNSELEDDDEEEDDYNLNHSFNHIRIKHCFNNNNNNTDDDFSFANNSSTNLNDTSTKRKKLNTNKYCKKRKCRTTFTKSQLITLESEFLKSNFVSNDRIDILIDLTGLDSRIIKNWFKNKRSRVLADSKSSTSNNYNNSNLINKLDSGFNFKLEKISELNLNQLTPSSSSSLPDSNSPNSTTSSHQSSQLYVQTTIFNNLKESDKQFSFKNNYLPLDSNTFQAINTEVVKNQSNGLLNILSNNTINLNQEMNENKLALNKISYSPPVTPNLHKQHLCYQYQQQQQPKQTSKLVIKNDASRKFNLNDLKDTHCNVCSKSSKLFCVCDVSKTALNRLYRNCTGFNTYFDSTTRLRTTAINTDMNQMFIESDSKLFEIL